jgi:hypothetical protein
LLLVVVVVVPDALMLVFFVDERGHTIAALLGFAALATGEAAGKEFSLSEKVAGMF